MTRTNAQIDFQCHFLHLVFQPIKNCWFQQKSAFIMVVLYSTTLLVSKQRAHQINKLINSYFYFELPPRIVYDTTAGSWRSTNNSLRQRRDSFVLMYWQNSKKKKRDLKKKEAGILNKSTGLPPVSWDPKSNELIVSMKCPDGSGH